MGITTLQAFEVLDDELIEACWIEDMFGEEAVEQLADDWCRTQHSLGEIEARQRLAGVQSASVIRFPIPADQLRLAPAGRRAA